jgi:hypothetical protein
MWRVVDERDSVLDVIFFDIKPTGDDGVRGNASELVKPRSQYDVFSTYRYGSFR